MAISQFSRSTRNLFRFYQRMRILFSHMRLLVETISELLFWRYINALLDWTTEQGEEGKRRFLGLPLVLLAANKSIFDQSTQFRIYRRYCNFLSWLEGSGPITEKARGKIPFFATDQNPKYLSPKWRKKMRKKILFQSTIAQHYRALRGDWLVFWWVF